MPGCRLTRWHRYVIVNLTRVIASIFLLDGDILMALLSRFAINKSPLLMMKQIKNSKRSPDVDPSLFMSLSLSLSLSLSRFISLSPSLSLSLSLSHSSLSALSLFCLVIIIYRKQSVVIIIGLVQHSPVALQSSESESLQQKQRTDERCGG